MRKQLDPGDIQQAPADQSRRLDWVFRGILLAAGIYLAIVYFGQKAVPNSDFPGFVLTGSEILHFRMPTDFKRVPVLGILQIVVSQFMFTSLHPILTGGLVLNGILYVFSILLFYQVCRFFIAPTGSFCLCLLAALNPWALALVVTPIAETAIVFFLLLTLYLILKRSWWCYPAAMLASMTRYECFGLIGIALLFDLFGRAGKRQKLIAAGAAFTAAVPMILWMIGTTMTATGPQSSYFHHFLNVEHRNGFDLLKMLWQTSFSSLLQWPEWIRAVLIVKPASRQAAEAIGAHQGSFQAVWNFLTAAFFVSGVVWVFIKKEWKFLSILLFWLGYVCIHAAQRVLLDRYTVPVIWLTLLIAVYGLTCSVRWAAGRAPKWLFAAVATAGAVIAVFWTLYLWPAVGSTARISAESATAAYAGCILLLMGLAVKQSLYRRKFLFWDVCLLFVVMAMVVSNQFMLSFRLEQGDQDIEFKKLAEWYVENAGENEKLVTTMKGVVEIFAPGREKLILHTGGVSGKDFAEFTQTCKKWKVTYVAWDSRLGLVPKDEYYKLWGLQKVHPLSSGKDVGPFKFIQKIEGRPQRYINLYRLELENASNP